MSTARAQIHLFDSDSPPPGGGDDYSGNGTFDDGLTPDNTWTEFFERYVVPQCLVNSEPRNITQIRETLGCWRRFTGDPSMRLTTRRTTSEFLGVRDARGRYVSGLWSLPGRKPGEPISPNTVRKHCVEMQRLFTLAGPATRKPEARELLDRAPWIAKPAKVTQEVIDNYSLDELKLVRQACRGAKYPRRALGYGLTPATFFNALYVFDYHVGARIGTLLEVCYSWFSRDIFGERCLNVPARHTKGKRHGLCLYVHDDAWAAIEAIRTPDRDLIFPWRFGESWLHECRRRILRVSGLPAHRQLGFHGCRKAMTTEVGAINGQAATMAAGHAGKESSVTRESYMGRKVMIAAMKQVPRLVDDDESPDAFLGASI